MFFDLRALLTVSFFKNMKFRNVASEHPRYGTASLFYAHNYAPTWPRYVEARQHYFRPSHAAVGRRSVSPHFRLELADKCRFRSHRAGASGDISKGISRQWLRRGGTADTLLQSYPPHPSLLVRVTFARDDQRRHSSQARICGIAIRTQASKPCVTIWRGNQRVVAYAAPCHRRRVGVVPQASSKFA